MKNIIKRYLKENKQQKNLYGYFMNENMYTLCNGISIVRLHNNDMLVDVEEVEGIKLTNMITDVKNETSNNVFTLPTVKELKYLKENKTDNCYRPQKSIHWYCDIDLLINILEIINVKNEVNYICINTDNKKPSYIYNGKNNALILPVYVLTEEQIKEQEKVREENRKAEQERKEKEIAKRKEEMTNFYKSIEEAEKSICENKEIKNNYIVYYVNDEQKETSIILYLFKKYKIDIPLKTQGWINKALVSLNYIEEDQKYSYKYYSSSKNSSVFNEYLQMLVYAIKKEYGYLTTEQIIEEQKIIDTIEYKQIFDKAIEPIKVEKRMNKIEISPEARLFWKCWKNEENIVHFSEEQKIILYSRMFKLLKLDNIPDRVKEQIETDIRFKEKDYYLSCSYGNIKISVSAIYNEEKIIYKFTKTSYKNDDVYLKYETLPEELTHKDKQFIDLYNIIHGNKRTDNNNEIKENDIDIPFF